MCIYKYIYIYICIYLYICVCVSEHFSKSFVTDFLAHQTARSRQGNTKKKGKKKCNWNRILQQIVRYGFPCPSNSAKPLR